ncbi:histone H1t-like [Cavia porcellus]|uniref:H15 domain-containing protein n=1 Tax=Cavia porcellus TaxID=10141 RepID=H0W175_CAVPO|nr:histone H1t-like [Cavia porcellus]
MFETLPAVPTAPAPGSMGKLHAKRRGRKGICESSVNQKAQSSSLSELINQSLMESQDRVGMSLVALKKSLAATGYNVKKNNSRIKQALKSLVSKGVVVQIRGTGASGSFRLSKNAAPEITQSKVGRPASAKNKKLGLDGGPSSPKSTKTNTGGKQSKVAHREASGRKKKVRRSKSLQQLKSPAKAKVGKAKARIPKSAMQKANSRKAVSKK